MFLSTFSSPLNEHMTQTVIFLDIDGVFNTSRCLLEDYEVDDQSLLFVKELCPDITEYIVPLEKHHIMNLKWIMDQCDASFVISSTWRQQDEYKRFFLEALRSCGVDTNRYLGDTPSLSPIDGRGAEIKHWLDRHPEVGEKFVIIDDDHEHSFRKNGVLKNFVKTVMRSGVSTEEGLSKEKATDVLRMLRSFEGRNVE